MDEASHSEGLAELALGLHIDAPPQGDATGVTAPPQEMAMNSSSTAAARMKAYDNDHNNDISMEGMITACLPSIWSAGDGYGGGGGGGGGSSALSPAVDPTVNAPTLSSPRGSATSSRNNTTAWSCVGPQILPVFDDGGVTPQSIAELRSAPDVMDARRGFGFILAHKTCYDLLPDSGKIVVFDTALLVKKAFFALVQNGIRSAPLWDSRLRKFVGMITITDFINILRRYYRSPLVTMDELEEHKIQTWREMCSLPDDVISIEPSATLKEAVRILIDSKIHRLPLIDSVTGSAVAILTHKRVLGYLHPIFMENPPAAFQKHSIYELGIGTYRNIATASRDMPLIIVLNVFHERRVSAVPIVDESGVVVDVYAKFDVMNLARERAYNNLDVSVKEALLHRPEVSDGLHTCLKTDNLMTIIDRIVRAKVHRLIVIDSTRRVVGIVSLSDILGFLLVN